LLTNRKTVMGEFSSALRTRVVGWVVAGVIVALNVVLVWQIVAG